MRKLALLFPGQGSQYIGMGKELLERSSTARVVFAEADEVLGFNLQQLIANGSPEELTRTENAQPALLTVSVAAFRVYMEEIGVEPAYMAGHSLGEFSALTCAGVMSFADALRLVRSRGQLMQQAAAEGVGAMCAIIGSNRNRVEEACVRASTSEERTVVISNYNSSEQLVISGHRSAVEDAARELELIGARIAFLKVSAPFHSPLMNSAAIQFQEELAAYSYTSFKWPVLSNVTGKAYESPEHVVSYLTQQLTAPVRWDDSMKLLHSEGVSVAVELGAKQVLTQFMKVDAASITCYPYEKAAELDFLRNELAADKLTQLRKQVTNNVVTKCLAAAVCTRNRNWDLEEYEQGFVIPYRQIQRLQEQLDVTGAPPTEAQMQEALELLKGMLETKKVPQTELQERFADILKQTGTTALFPAYASA
ncbi:ACP S-malonyltransferase [Paenibacillus sp. GSMTC-2017]|uniref:ACP S-malonyltransferase n=1 Tax=Paenibacillus sp. GSMTC-2017 TaxID=2794350 RepID=UPI0018DA0339|nr:ACP S-malonyltransferase [Paenibacillus sp. GSMTC-2017]MBH5320332.1 ACP S-malonyltransferase [Paenibacillus sp. GSMTC-2017]